MHNYRQYNGQPEDKVKSNGIVYTPQKLADFLAYKVLNFYLSDIRKSAGKRFKVDLHSILKKLRILDPASGDGNLLAALYIRLFQYCSRYGNMYNLSQIHKFHGIFCGIDNDLNAVRALKSRFKNISNGNIAKDNIIKILNTNALFPFNKASFNTGWKIASKYFNAPEGFDIIIANPPWGADVSHYKGKFDSKEYDLCKGQFDTSDIFVELALKLLKNNGYLAYILPDSLFGFERIWLRKLLAEQTQIKFVGRFGEKIFNNVNRACVIIICKKNHHNNQNKTECLHLSHSIKDKILNGEIDFEEAEKYSHVVLQKRFKKNRNFIFDIDLKANEENLLGKFERCASLFGNYLQGHRGVELSKYGEVYQCSHCFKWIPIPSKARTICKNCNNEIIVNKEAIKKIINHISHNGHKPIFVGEHIQRYHLKRSFWIDVTKNGIGYKDNYIYAGPKILVRKTGVGVSAAIDYSNSLTNQVVYIFKQKDSIKGHIPLEFFLGVLNSRAITYYVLKKYGETEWRSHAYLTQKHILEIPLPELNQIRIKYKNVINDISRNLRNIFRRKNDITSYVDSKVERAVASLYGLDRRDYCAIYSTINSAQNLRPLSVLKDVSIENIFNQ